MHTFISESEAAMRLGYKPYTLRLKVTGTGTYFGKERLKIRFTTSGKGFRYCAEDCDKILRKGMSGM